jgi:nitric oxide synthase-interacting protein
MTRKSKQAGGNMPLTSYERKKYGKPYGTTTARLAGTSQYTFGHCALSLHPAKEQPVTTPSGFIYERPAMLQYLLHQTQSLKQAQQKYDQGLQTKQVEETKDEDRKRTLQIEKFEDDQKVVKKKQKVNEANPLKNSSFWLADFQPKKADATTATGTEEELEPPPKRPSSPMSQKPLRRKDLISLDLKRNTDEQVICAVSEKSIVHQQALALITKSDKPAQVVLEQVYNDLGKEKVCPVTGRKISKILKLQKGGSSFAASGGNMEAQTYRPCMT